MDFNTITSTVLGFTIALSWNNAVNKTIDSFYPDFNNKSVIARASLFYALIITITVILIIHIINYTQKSIYKNLNNNDIYNSNH
jgi:hypothetical protein